MNAMPAPLRELVDFFSTLSEAERRENLIDLATAAKNHAPREDERFDFEEVRKDAECSDTVGIHARMGDDTRMHFAISLGPQVQTLTRAMATILCRGLSGAKAADIIATPRDFVTAIIGEQLVRQRSQTVYYVLGRLQEAARMTMPR